MNADRVPFTLFGAPAISWVLDTALFIAIVKVSIVAGALTERIEQIGRQEQVIETRLLSSEQINSMQQSSLSATDAHYSDIVRRLDSIDRKLERGR